MIGYIDEAAATDRPFFGYLAYTAPHWPIQALDEDMARVRGRYDEGYDVIRERRFQRLKDLGLSRPAPPDRGSPPALTPWNELTRRAAAEQIAVMEAYAAMVERLDMEIGRVSVTSRDSASSTTRWWCSCPTTVPRVLPTTAPSRPNIARSSTTRRKHRPAEQLQTDRPWMG